MVREWNNQELETATTTC